MTAPAVPPAALALGAAGLIPSAAAAAAVLLGPRDVAALGFLAGAIYGATILSFLGGAWWGLAAARADARDLAPWLVVAVAPSLVAGALLVALSPLAVGGLAAAFLVALLADLRLAAAGLAPDWWLRLRVPLSLGMGVLHLVIALAAPA